MIKSISKCKGFFSAGSENNKSFAKYTVVSACYNVSSYLEDYFNSMVRQTIGFNNVFLIMVDDGSTDDTAAIIKKWVNRYPDNISYLFKENGGQASARNLGLNFVKTPWVTFTDPDDFLDKDFFFNIDRFLLNNYKKKKILLIASNIVFYNEEKNEFKENHPLAQKFNASETVVPIVNLKNFVQLHAASSVFNSNILQKYRVYFPDLRPTLEDGAFIISALMKECNYEVAFLRNSKYYYRKREDHTSTLDKAWSNPGQYLDVLEKGCIPILQSSVNSPISETVQFDILYHLFWHIKYVVNKPEGVDCLSDVQKTMYLDYMDKCFSYISKDVIFKFSLCNIWYYEKSGIINCFKKESIPVMFLYVIKHDPVKDEILIRYFTGVKPLEQFFINDTEVFPTHIKWVKDDFLTRVFIYQRLVWLPLNNREGKLKVFINGNNPKIVCKNLRKDIISLKEIRANFDTSFVTEAPWLFMDRLNKADDNAEHLYRYIMRHCPVKKNIYYLLTKDSDDWSRLEKEGFNLVEFGSKLHRDLPTNGNKIISSHIDIHVTDYWKDGSLDSKQIVFLQHGVTKDNLANWLNNKKRIDLFVTATVPEYESIVGEDSRYRYTDKEVRLLGFARHDTLLKDSTEARKKVIMIMPTWRASLASNQFGKMVINPGFQESDYYQAWTGLLLSDELRQLSEKYGYKVLFFPHPIMKDLLHLIKLPGYITIPGENSGSIQERFKECSVLITDYSSVGFEVGYLAKPVLYYQFDEDVFWKQQVYQKGYFDYRKDGFGPVCTTKQELLTALEDILSKDCQNIPGLQEKVDATYSFRDGHCCERTLEAIFDLEKPNKPNCNLGVIRSFVKQALTAGNFQLARERALYLRSVSAVPEHAAVISLLNLKSRIDSSRLNIPGNLLRSSGAVSSEFADLYDSIYAEYLAFTGKFDETLAFLSDPDRCIANKNSLMVLVSERMNLTELPATVMSSAPSFVKKIYEYYLKHQYGSVASLFAVPDTCSDKLLSASLRKVYDHCAVVKEDPYLCAVICRSAIECAMWQVDSLLRVYIEKLRGRRHLWRILEAMRVCRNDNECSDRAVYINLMLAYRNCANFMSVLEFAKLIRAMRNLFSFKVFKNKVMRIQSEEVPLISDPSKRKAFEDIITEAVNHAGF